MKTSNNQLSHNYKAVLSRIFLSTFYINGSYRTAWATRESRPTSKQLHFYRKWIIYKRFRVRRKQTWHCAAGRLLWGHSLPWSVTGASDTEWHWEIRTWIDFIPLPAYHMTLCRLLYFSDLYSGDINNCSASSDDTNNNNIAITKSRIRDYLF